jgi:hypothetical protein
MFKTKGKKGNQDEKRGVWEWDENQSTSCISLTWDDNLMSKWKFLCGAYENSFFLFFGRRMKIQIEGYEN